MSSLKLHGFAISNYYNIVKLALLEKGQDFEEVPARPGREEAFLKISPAGKIPALECPEGCLSETRAILQYLEGKAPQPSLISPDPFTAGRADQIYALIHLNLDAAVRPLFGAAFFGAEADPAALEKMKEELAFGMGALARVTQFSPYIAGEHYTLADLAAVNTLPLVSQAAQSLGQPDPLAGLTGWKDYLAGLQNRPAVQRVLADTQKALEAFFRQSARA